MSQKPLFVSVIIPVYNGERFLRRAIANVREQNYQPLEIIVVDDGSTDGTANIAAEHREVRYFYQENQGPAAARNLGIKEAKGEAIAFLDVDDLWSANKLELQTACLKQQPSVDIFQGFTQIKRRIADEEVYADYRAPYFLSVLSSALYRRSVFERVGLFDAKLIYGEDTDWFLRAWENRIEQVILDEVTLFYYKHDENMTKGKDRKQLGLVRVYHQHLQRCRQNPQLNQQKSATDFPGIGEYIGRDSQLLVKNDRFTLIANDRWGETIYKYLGLMPHSPFIGTRIMPPCYLKLLKNLQDYLALPLVITDKSRYPIVNQQKAEQDLIFGVLQDEVEIQFIGSNNAAEVVRNWQKRVKRINWDNLYVVLNQHNHSWNSQDLSLISEFDKLDFERKVCFADQEYSELKSVVFVPQKITYSSKVWQAYEPYFDIIAWLNQKHTNLSNKITS